MTEPEPRAEIAAFGVPCEVLVRFEQQIVEGILTEWEAETAAIGWLLCAHGQAALWREVYQLHNPLEAYAAGDELVFLREHPPAAAEP
jgi:hypothetical protein